MKVGAITQVGENMLGGRKVFLADPGDAFSTHLGKGIGATIHPDGHIVAADAGHCAGAFGHARRRVVGAARTEPGLAILHDNRPLGILFLGMDNRNAGLDAGANLVGKGMFFQAFGNGLGDNRRRQFVIGRQ